MVRNCEPTKMETTFYDEQAYQHTNVNQLKRNLTLDLGQTKIAMKRQKMENNNSPLLSTPDLNMLKVRTPELDTLVLLTQQNGEVPATPTQLLFPKIVTEAQEAYVRGFENALYELQQSDSSQGLQSVDLPVTTATSINTTLSGGCTTYTDLDQPDLRSFQMKNGFLDNIVIKDEPLQTVPSMGTSPPLSPIDMECQERIKLERKRQRNRVAASKCRRRKLERISKLEEKVKQLKGENAELSGIVSKLRAQVVHLKQQVLEHVNAGCSIITQY